MSTSIRISEGTKQKPEAVKRDDEAFDELLDRLAVTRTPDDVEAMAGFVDEGIEITSVESDSSADGSNRTTSRDVGFCVALLGVAD